MSNKSGLMNVRKKITQVNAFKLGANFTIASKYGNLAVTENGWTIVYGPDDVYPCDPDVFESTYEHVEGSLYQTRSDVIVQAEYATERTVVQTIDASDEADGEEIAEPGDVIMTGVLGERYVMIADTFKKKYDILTDEEVAAIRAAKAEK